MGEIDDLDAHGLQAVLGMEAVDHVAMQLGLALELRERERGEGQDDDRRDRERDGRQTRGRGPAPEGHLLARSAKASFAAPTVASSSGCPCADETNPASNAEGAR